MVLEAETRIQVLTLSSDSDALFLVLWPHTLLINICEAPVSAGGVRTAGIVY